MAPTREAADVLIDGLGNLLRAQLTGEAEGVGGTKEFE